MNVLNEKDLEGKVISLGMNDSILALYHVAFEEFGHRVFLTGTVPRGATTNDWAEGVKAGVALDSITEYMIFDSIEDYNNRLEISDNDELVKK